LLLTPEEKDTIANENQALIFYVVKLFRSTKIPYDELVSIANLGFGKALNSYDTERKTKFSTYAISCMRNEVLLFFRKEKLRIYNDVSMDATLATDKEGKALNIEDTMSQEYKEGRLSLEDDLLLNEDLDYMQKAIRHLTEREQYIITYRYGLVDGIILTQEEIARQIDMSQANVSKLEKVILGKLQTILKEQYNIEEIVLR